MKYLQLLACRHNSRSSLARGTWIEIAMGYDALTYCGRPSQEGRGLKSRVVFAHAPDHARRPSQEGRGLKLSPLASAASTSRRPSQEGRGLKCISSAPLCPPSWSSLARGTWIEIFSAATRVTVAAGSSLARGTWIEIFCKKIGRGVYPRRPSQEGRGLKCSCSPLLMLYICVVPRKRDVD